MTGKHVSLAFAFVAVLLMPSRAAAEGGLWEFLEKLSGPGPFYGIVFDVPIVCRLRPKVAGSPDRATAYFDQCWNSRLLREDLRSQATKGGFQWRRHFSFGANIAKFGTDKNNLSYAQPEQAVGVRWLKFGGRVTWHSEFIDLHASIDGNRLTSKQPSLNDFDAVWFMTFEPVGVTFKPFARVNSLVRHVTVAVRPHSILRTLDAEMFGAAPGKLDDPWPPRWQVGIHIDPWRY